MSYSFVPIIALLVLAIINFDLLFKKKDAETFPALREYRFFLISICVFCVADILWGFLDAYHLTTANYINTVVFFFVMAISVWLWALFVVSYLGERNAYENAIRIVGWIFMFVGLALIAINFFAPLMFEFVDGEYKAGPLRHAYFITQAVMYILVSIYAIGFSIYHKEFKSNYIAIGSFGIVMAAMIAIQIFYPQLPIYSFGYLIGLLFVYSFAISTQKKEFREEIEEGHEREQKAQELAYIDALTGAKSKHAYVELEEKIDKAIAETEISFFSVIVMDLNDLKYINDKVGHDAGDQYLINSFKMICEFFPRDCVYRFGGDEFAVVLTGDDYRERHERLNAFNRTVDYGMKNGEPIIATGFADFRIGKDNTYRSVFNRADERMYIRKRQLKESGKIDLERLKSFKIDLNNYKKLVEGDALKTREEILKKENPRLAFYKTFYQNEEYPLIDYLNNSSCDVMSVIDFKHNTSKLIYNVEGKYFVPPIDNVTYESLFDFVANHIVHPEDRRIYINQMNPEGFFERIKQNEIPNFSCEQFRYKLSDGTYRYVEQCLITGLENGIPEGSLKLYIFDIDNYVARQKGFINEDITASKGRDSVTSLIQEKEFIEEGQQMINDNTNREWCLISIDIIHFRFYDEWYGREAGDLMLSKIGSFLAEKEKEIEGLSGYFGKDDFTVLMPFDEAKIHKLHQDLKDLIISFGSTAAFTPAFGVARVEEGLSLVDAFERAMIAETKAKADIANRICIYTPDLQFLAQQEYRILSEYMKAFKNKEITFFLQPQVRATTGKVVGVEALARWIKPDGTIVPPMEFIPILEKYGFIPDLDLYLWEQAFMSVSDWMKSGHNAVPISLNVSRIDLFSINVGKCLLELAQKYQIPHDLIKVEITESSYVEATALVNELVKFLHEHDFQVLMDDFGSGYSSLNMLSNLKIDAIKLDGKFLHIDSEFEGGRDKAINILESVVYMAKTIGLPIIVEGVERKDQIDFLEGIGCRYIQGYYFYRPMPKKDFEALIEDENMIDRRGFIVKSNEQVRIREFLDKNIYSDSMLNNILGPVAFYSFQDNRTHIVRYNEQFYQAVHVPDFSERLEDIEQFLHPDDIEKMHNAFRRAIEDRLNGASETLRFFTIDGTVLSFYIHFYHLGNKEGGERFYGSANNVTALTDLQEEKHLMANFSKDSVLFVRKVSGQLLFSVPTRGLADIFDITPTALEEELNNHEFEKKRVVSRRKFEMFMTAFQNFAQEKKNFEASLDVYDSNHHSVLLHLSFTCVSGISNNIAYILRTTVAK